MSRHLPLIAFALLGATDCLAAEGGAAGEWLLKASEAARHANYQGIVVYRDSDMLETLRVVHRHKNGREQERITSLNGAPRDIFREDDHVTCIVADDHQHSVAGNPQSLFPVMSRETLAQVTAHYDLRNLGQARVAGRESRGVAILPRDEFRYGYEVWADLETAVPLRVSLLDSRGNAIEQLMFTEIAFPAVISDKAFAVPTRGHGLAPPAGAPPRATEVAAPAAWALGQLPPGFRIAMRDVRPGPDGEGVVEHVLVTDGLSAVSVFRARTRLPDKMFRGLSHMGAMNAYGRLIGAFHVTIVGEVPQSTVRLIGDSLEESALDGQGAATDPASAGP